MTLAKTLTRKLGAIALTAGFATMAGQVAAQTCGSTYQVRPGDSLAAISDVVYGDAGSYQIIYSANSEVIGPNPGLIRVGMRLDLPCLNNVRASTADASAITQLMTTNALPEPNKRAIRFVVGTDWAPFTHEDLEQGGMATEIANVAMANADGNPDYKIDFINDWGAHLQPLISDHAYDFSLVWFRPNCDVIEKLGEGSQFRCNNLKWSDPIFEQVIGYFTRTNEGEVTNHSSLMGKKVCRPAGYSTYMMEEVDLVEPNITMYRPNAVVDCFTALDAGEVDAVVLASDTAQGAITEIGAGDRIRMNDKLSKIATMHAIIAYNHPAADQMLETLNSGLRKIKQNGEWFGIVQRHLAAYRAANS